MEKNTVIINKKTASNTKIIEINGDVIVPDIKPDIISVINTNGIPYIYKEDISNGRVRFDGNIDTYVVYLADNGETRSIQTTLSFSDTIEESNIAENAFSKQNISLENIEAKVLNERKLSIRASLKVRSEVFEKSEIDITSDFNEIENVEKLKETLNIKSVIGSNKVKTSIKEDISVDNSYMVAELLKTDVEVTNVENKISYNKVLTKADANVKVVFLSEDGRIGVASSTIPVMSFIDIDKVADTHTCNVEYFIRNMLFKANSKEQHSITCQIDFEVWCDAFETKTVDVIQDMYGIRNTIDFTKRDVEVQVESKDNCERININERILVEDLLNICDVSCRPKIVARNKSGNFVNCECELAMTVYYEADNRNGLNVKNITLPFMVKADDESDDFEFVVSRKNFTASQENVNCDIEILARCSNNSLKRITVIDDVSCRECDEEDEYKMFMYFVKAGDTVWEIAKRFKVCMSDIIRLNNLECPDKLKVGDRLYIMR